MKSADGKAPTARAYVPLSDALRADAAALSSGMGLTERTGLSHRLLQYAQEAAILEAFRDATLAAALESMNAERMVRKNAPQ